MTLPAFAHARATTVDEALAELAGGAVPYHGGTELLAVLRLGLARPERLVDLKPVAELRGVRRDGDLLQIGAGTTHKELGADPLVRADAPLLGEVADLVGNVRVRASGTVGGNLCFAEPKSDVATALLALAATVTLRSPAGQRELPLDEFLLGAYETALEPGELLTAVSVRAGAAAAAAYCKLQTAERPTVGVAAAAPGTASTRYRVVVGAVGELPVVIERDELAGFDARAIAAEVDVIPDLAGEEDYKRHVTAVYVGRALAALRAREAAA